MTIPPPDKQLKQPPGGEPPTTTGDVVSKFVVDFNAMRRKQGLPTFEPGHKPVVTYQPPMFPPGLKLRDHKMPFDGSEFYAHMAGADAKAEAAAMRLMWRSWIERPTGTLPNDDHLLRQVAGIDSARSWARQRAVALRPFAMCSDGRWHCHLLVEPVAAIVRARAVRRQSDGSRAAVGWLQFAKWFAERSKIYAENGTSSGRSDLPTRPNSFLPSIKQSVLLPRARLTDPTPTPTPTRPKDAQQDHEHEGQVEMALPADWRPSAGDIEAVKAARPDLDDVAIERQRQRFVRKARGTATADEWTRRFMAWAKGGHGKPWSARTGSSPSPALASNGDARSSREPDEIAQWRARLRNYRPEQKFWPSDWGPRPGQPGCEAPHSLLVELGLLP